MIFMTLSDIPTKYNIILKIEILNFYQKIDLNDLESP